MIDVDGVIVVVVITTVEVADVIIDAWDGDVIDVTGVDDVAVSAESRDVSSTPLEEAVWMTGDADNVVVVEEEEEEEVEKMGMNAEEVTAQEVTDVDEVEVEESEDVAEGDKVSAVDEGPKGEAPARDKGSTFCTGLTLATSGDDCDVETDGDDDDDDDDIVVVVQVVALRPCVSDDGCEVFG